MILKHFGPELDTKEGLEKFYYSTGCAEICKKLNINAKLLYRRLQEFGIPPKNKPTYDAILTKEWFEENYYKNKLSISELAKKVNISTKTILILFKKHQIKARSFSEAGKLRSSIIRSQMKKQWSDPNYIKKMTGNYSSIKEKMAILSQNQLGKVSKIQTILYSILDDLKIKYEPEKIIGFWTYDCFIPDHNLIIECQGDYWHKQKEAQVCDQTKATYLERYFPQYKLKHIWEHEFMCKDRIIKLIKYWTGIDKPELIDFNFQDIVIKEVSDEDAKLFIAKYHYFGRIGRNSVKYGAFLGDMLVAVCTFASITRRESATRIGHHPNSMRELTRFCIHPSYQKKNFATWFLSRCITLIKTKI